MGGRPGRRTASGRSNGDRTGRGRDGIVSKRSGRGRDRTASERSGRTGISQQKKRKNWKSWQKEWKIIRRCERAAEKGAKEQQIWKASISSQKQADG